MATTAVSASSDLLEATWRKSSGGSEQTNCVEVAELRDHVAMRDSKDPAGPMLTFTRAEWRTFLGDVRAGEFD